MNDANGFKQLVSRGAFEYVTLCTRLYRCQNAFVTIEGRKYDCAHLGIVRLHLLEGFNSIHPGHLEIKEHQVGPKVRRLLYCFSSTTRFPNHCEVRLRTQYGDETIPYHRMIIGNEYSDRFAQVDSQRDADRNSRPGPYTGLQTHLPAKQSCSLINTH